MDQLPQKAEAMLGGEHRDFVVRSHRAHPLRQALPVFFFGLFWFGITILVFFGMFGSLFSDQEISFFGESGGLLFPAIFFGVFFLVGIGILVYAGLLMFKGGSWYVGMSDRLFVYRKDDVQSLDWELFSGDVHVHGTPQNGTITLRMRTGKVLRHKHGESVIPHEIYITGIPQAYAIGQICIDRIKQNEPIG